MTALDVVSILLVLLPAGDWLAAYILARVARAHPRDAVLREWTRWTVLAAIGATLVALIVLNRVLMLGLPPELVTATFVAILLGISFPPYAFLYLYWRGRF